jgi:hypothetical protein
MTQQPQALKLLGVLFCGAIALIAVQRKIFDALWLCGHTRPDTKPILHLAKEALPEMVAATTPL